jgi:hypothetical protein
MYTVLFWSYLTAVPAAELFRCFENIYVDLHILSTKSSHQGTSNTDPWHPPLC